MDKFTRVMGYCEIIAPVKDFISWLNNEMQARGLSQSELARRAGVSQSGISMLFSQNRQPGPDLCTALAHALKLPPEVVFRAAGLLPPVSEPSSMMSQIMYLVDQLPEERQKQVLEFVEWVTSRRTPASHDPKDDREAP